MIWIFIAVGVGILAYSLMYDEGLWDSFDTFMASWISLLVAGFFFFVANAIFAGVLDQSRSYETTKLVAIDANGSLLEINKYKCIFNLGKGISDVPREKCEVVESDLGEIKTTLYSPNKTWTVFTWSDYNRFYVTRDQVSYGG